MLTDEDFPSERKKVFLDLDNTLISSVPTKEFSITDPKTKERALSLDFHNMDDYYIIFERPGLQEFLDYLFANFDVNIWSAASKDYVVFIADKIVLKDKPDRKLGYVLFSYQCDLSRKLYKDGIKDLRLVWDELQIDGFTPENTVIVDDLKKVKKINGENCVAVMGFEFTKDGAERDEDLKRIRERLEEFKKSGVVSNDSSREDSAKVEKKLKVESPKSYSEDDEEPSDDDTKAFNDDEENEEDEETDEEDEETDEDEDEDEDETDDEDEEDETDDEDE